MLAVVLALAAAMSFGGSDFTAGLASRRGGKVASVTMTAEAVKTVVVLPFVLLASSQFPSGPSLAWGTVAGISGGLGEMALYASMRKTAFSVASAVSAIGAAVFSVLAGLFLGERPGVLLLGGMVLTPPAIVGVCVGRRVSPSQTSAGGTVADETERDDVRGAVWALAAGLGFGLSLLALNRAGSRTDLWPIAVAELAALTTVACIAAKLNELQLPPVGVRRLAVLTGVMGTAGICCFFLATHRGSLAVTAVIYSLYPAGTILLAWRVSKEKPTKVGLAGLALAAASVSLIAAGGAH